MEAILAAREVNLALGGPFVGPWDMQELPEDFIDTVRGLVERLPRYVAARRKADEQMAAWRPRAEGKVH